MKKLSFNQGTLVIKENQIFFELPAKELMIDTLEELEPIFHLPEISFPCQVNRSDDQKNVCFHYQIEPGFLPFQQLRSGERLIKLVIADQLARIAHYFETQAQLVTVFHPLNIFADHLGRVRLLYCGIKGLMPADGYEQEPILDQVRRLIIMLFSEAHFDDLRINGTTSAYQQAIFGEQSWIKQLHIAKDFNRLISFIQQEQQSSINGQSKIVEATGQTDKKQTTMISEQTSSLALTDPNQKPPQLPLLPRRRQRLIDWFIALRRHKLLYILSLLTIGSLLFLTILYLMIQNSLQPISQVESQSSVALTGLRLAAIQEYKLAEAEFARLDFKRLDRADQKAVIFTYLRMGKYEKVLSLNRTYADVVIEYLLRTDHIDAVERINSQLPEILFEKAALKRDLSTMMSQQRKIKMNERRHKLVIDGYMMNGDVEGARHYIDQLDERETLENYIQNYSLQ